MKNLPRTVIEFMMLRPANESIRQRLAQPMRRATDFLKGEAGTPADLNGTLLLALIPDWCNAGIAIRVIAAWNLIAMAMALSIAADLTTWAATCLNFSLAVEPILISSLLVGCLSRPFVIRLPVAVQGAFVLLVPAVLTWIWEMTLGGLRLSDARYVLRDAVLAGCAAGATLYWARLRGQSHLPALAEARLSALQARIRPHFLFNSLNAVLGLIRSDARRAESILEDLADLFRVLMRDHHERVSLAEELALCRKYLDIESLRLGARLVVDWQVDAKASAAQVPLLLLQPLVENAVLHGIEPLSLPGVIEIHIARRGHLVDIRIANPWHGEDRRRGHQIGLANVRQRLELLHDLEATLTTRVENQRFILEMTLPYLRQPGTTAP